MRPELAWLQVKTLVQGAILEQFEESEKLRLKANYPKDLGDLTVALEMMNPISAINHLHYANENLDLQNIMKQKPLKVLGALFRMFMESDRWNGGPD